MFRIPSRLGHHVTSKLVRAPGHSVRRKLSAQAGATGGVSKLLIAAGGVAGGVGGLVGFSALDVENRKKVQGIVPGSSLINETFLGPLEEAAPAKPVEIPEIPALPESAPAEAPVEEAVVEADVEEVAAEPAEPVVEAEVAPEPVAVPEPVAEPEPVVEPVVEPVAEPVIEPVAEPELVAEPVAETVAEPEPVAVTVAEPEPVAETLPEPVAEPTPEVAPVESPVQLAVEAVPEIPPAEAEVVVTETVVEFAPEVALPPTEEAIEPVAEVAPAAEAEAVAPPPAEEAVEPVAEVALSAEAEAVGPPEVAAPSEAEIPAEVAPEPAASVATPEVAPEVVTVPVAAEPLKADAASDQTLLIIATPGSITLDAIKLEEKQPSVAASEIASEPVIEAATDIESRLASNELAEEVENATLNQLLDDLSHTAQKKLTAALSAAEDASITIRRHAERAYQAIDAGSSEEKQILFAEVAELSKKRADMVQAAEKGISETLDALKFLSEQIAIGRSSSLTKNNKKLISADETLGELKYAADKVQSLLTDAGRDAKVVSDYRDLVEAGRTQFEEEVKCLLPEVRLGESGDKLSPDELNLLIAHAHRKVLQLQKQIAGSQSLEHERFKEALDKQREDDEIALQNRIKSELANQEQLLDVEMRRQMAHLKEDLEADMRTQLKRQAAAHSDHLIDVLSVQKAEIETKWANQLQDEIHEQKHDYHKSVGTMQGQLEGLKAAMVSRSDVDKAAFAARELWLACDSLRTSLKLGNEAATTWEETPKPLNEQVAAVRKAAGDSNPFVSAVLSAISGEAVARGVYNYDALKERFIKVERICKRVSMIGDNGGSLLRYFLSYVQSFLVLNNFEYLPTNELKNQEVDINSLDTHGILNRARYCLDKDDLLLAVQYLNLLRGEPRNVAADWMKEARLSLETQQAAEALMAHAAATAVKTL